MSPDLHPHRSGVDLAEHVSLLRRRKVVFLLCLATGVLGGATLLRLTPPSYTATTQVLVAATGVQEQPNQVTGRQREALNLDTEAQIAQSAVVAAKAAALLKATPSPAEVTVPPNSAVLSIAVTETTPARAAAQSRAYAQAYLAHRAETAQAALTTQLKALLTKLKQVNKSMAKAVEEVAELRKGTAEHTIAGQRQNVLSRQVYSLTMKYDALKTVAVTPGYVISQAAEPTSPSSPSLPLYLGSGLMLGLLAGAAAAYGRDRLDTSLRAPCDVERLTGLPVLADLSGPADPSVMHDLASSVVAACPGPSLLVRAVPPALGTAAVEPLGGRARIELLYGSDVGDLARAAGALLVVGLAAARAGDVSLAARRLERHGVPIIGAVTVGGGATAGSATAASPMTPRPARGRPRAAAREATETARAAVNHTSTRHTPVEDAPVGGASGGSAPAGPAFVGPLPALPDGAAAGPPPPRQGVTGRPVNGMSPVTGDILSSGKSSGISQQKAPGRSAGKEPGVAVSRGNATEQVRRAEAGDTSPIPQVSDT
ncbi:Wzz/FepE/Etk N-terminal domain-containing protein [Nonomuraea dietziae]|uniref:Capsular polysaccharide biosynthesis protein n=1 Tax=Nonomuraea dietziae TaxID=65515 RepID=A0A7W5V4J3_9ACTN|nr:Wzz/FepE/Etk N-terminal domain-containing protein [Nonomuraea dietziae]MBB3730437.1 capsular polysaccharide biosynthesis protein [Nonomuraea dietziae]